MTSESKTVLILATMDTKGPEALYLRTKIEKQGLKPILMDLSTRGRRGSGADVGPAEVAKAGGTSLKLMASSNDRNRNMEAMVSGAVKTAHQLLQNNKIHGIFGVGGYSGSLMTSG